MNRKIYLVKKRPHMQKADIEWLQLSSRVLPVPKIIRKPRTLFHQAPR